MLLSGGPSLPGPSGSTPGGPADTTAALVSQPTPGTSGGGGSSGGPSAPSGGGPDYPQLPTALAPQFTGSSGGPAPAPGGGAQPEPEPAPAR